MQNVRISTAHIKFHQIYTLIGSLKFYLRSTEELYLKTLKVDAKFEKKLIFCFKNDENLVKFELKKYRGVIFHETEEGYKIWRGVD